MARNAQQSSVIKNVGRGAIAAVSAAAIAALFVLNYYANNAAGVNHYVYYNKLEYAKTILSPANLQVYGIASVIVALICVLRLILAARGGRCSCIWGSVSGLALVATATLMVLCAFTPIFAGMLLWAYFIFALMALEFLAVLLSLLA